MHRSRASADQCQKEPACNAERGLHLISVPLVHVDMMEAQHMPGVRVHVRTCTCTCTIRLAPSW